jgi:hypothetical protein
MNVELAVSELPCAFHPSEMIGDARDQKKWSGELKQFGSMPRMSSPFGEYFVDWKCLGGTEDSFDRSRRMEWLWCPTLMLPRQLNGHFISVVLFRRAEDLVFETRYHWSSPSNIFSTRLKCSLCLTVPLIGESPNMTLQQQGETQFVHYPNWTDLVVFPSLRWNKIDTAAPPSIVLRVLPTL